MAEQLPDAGTQKSALAGAQPRKTPPLSRYARTVVERQRDAGEEQAARDEEAAAKMPEEPKAKRPAEPAVAAEPRGEPEAAAKRPIRPEAAARRPAEAVVAAQPPVEPEVESRRPKAPAAATPLVVEVEPTQSEPQMAPGEAREHGRPAKWRHLRVGEQAGREPEHTGAIVPIPAQPTREAPNQDRVPFWKRLSLNRPAAAPHEPRSNTIEPILSRLASLENQVAGLHTATLNRLNGFEENITRLWELEDQIALTEVRERLALLEANQQEIADGLHAVARNLSVLAVVLGLSVAAGLLGLSFLT